MKKKAMMQHTDVRITARRTKESGFSSRVGGSFSCFTGVTTSCFVSLISGLLFLVGPSSVELDLLSFIVEWSGFSFSMVLFVGEFCSFSPTPMVSLFVLLFSSFFFNMFLTFVFSAVLFLSGSGSGSSYFCATSSVLFMGFSFISSISFLSGVFFSYFCSFGSKLS